MENKKTIAQLKKHYDKLAKRLSKIGPILQGSISERLIEKTDPENPERTKTIGPYYQWTFKRHAKTVTVNLSKSQFKKFQASIENNRKLEQTLKEMRELSREILDTSTKGVTRRNTNK